MGKNQKFFLGDRLVQRTLFCSFAVQLFRGLAIQGKQERGGAGPLHPGMQRGFPKGQSFSLLPSLPSFLSCFLSLSLSF